ncbi:MAG: hypothetical protein U0572_11455 [Phycisphaerales bacterium]
MPSRVSSAKSLTPAAGESQAEQDLASFIAKFEPKMAELIRECRRELKSIFPTAVELVYDNYNFFVIGYSSTERPSDCIVSIAAAANGVGLSFYYGAALPGPAGILQGSGKQNRFIRLSAVTKLREPEVLKLIHAAAAHGKTGLPLAGRGRLVIKSVSAKQRPRRRAKSAS